MPVNQSWLDNNIKLIITRLFKSEDARLKEARRQLVKENASMGESSDGFLYRGIFYTDLPSSRGTTRGKLSPSLVQKAEFFFQDESKIESDKHTIRQALALVLSECHHHQDIRDALSNSLVSLIPEVKDLPRMREEAYTIKHNQKMYDQYMKVKPLIEFYVAAKFLY